MAQAKTLTKQELKRLLDVTRGGSRYVEKGITMLLHHATTDTLGVD